MNTTGTYDFTYVKHEGQLVARKNFDGTTYFYQDDHLGSTSVITDNSGNIIENTSYSPYGEELSGGNLDVKGYTSQFDDEATGQMYYGARYYKPEVGLFVNGDSVISNLYNPQGLNRYAYVLNNPYKYVDPDGRDAIIVNYDIQSGSFGFDFGHSSVVVGNDDDGWTALWFGTDEGNVYEQGGISSLSVVTRGSVLKGKGSTWQGALKNLESSVPNGGTVGPHDTSTAVRFLSSKTQDKKMIEFMKSKYDNQKESKYNPIANNCANVVADVMRAGDIKTREVVFPNAYNKVAKVSAKINNLIYKTKSFLSKTFSSKKSGGSKK